MTQNELEDALMAYLARDDSDDPQFNSLTTIFEQLPEARSLEETSDDETSAKEALRVALDQLVEDGMIESRFGERDYEASYRITQDGFYQAVLGPEALVPEPKSGLFDPAFFDPAFFDTGEAVEGTTLPPVPSFASANWTGIDEKLGPSERAQISDLSTFLVAAINQAELDDRTKRTAVKHVEAVQKLLEAPDPPWKAIVDLLNHPAITAFLVAVQILQLIWGAAN